jgi:hypothetical protein
MILLYNIVMIKQQTTTTHTYTPTTPGLTDAGRPFVWKYRRVLGVTHDTYERSTGSGSAGWWSDVEPKEPRRGTVCPTHRVQRTPSGLCDLCD